MTNTGVTVIQHRQADGEHARLVGAFTTLPALIEFPVNNLKAIDLDDVFGDLGG